jgi:glyoxylase-like metal-dependent hydrolase (beta-lactamase superfamily II)
MSEPKTRAERIGAVAPGLLHWTVHDDRIDHRSEAYGLATPDGASTVLVDPLPLDPDALVVLGNVVAVVVTIQSHQRSAWRSRRHFGVKVHAPRGAEGLEKKPDQQYADGAELPGGLRAFRAPGPCDASYALLAERPAGRILFLGDVLMRGDSGPLAFVPSEYMDDPAAARESVRRLAALSPDIVCPGHGAPVIGGGARAMREALERDRGP